MEDPLLTEQSLKGTLVTVVFYYCTVTMIKVSICLFNLRLTGVTSRNWRIYHYVMLACLAGYALGVIFMFGLNCNPPLVAWRISDMGRRDYMTKCNLTLKSIKPNVAISVLHVVFDLFLLPVPLIVMRRLQMAKTERIRMVFLFLIGLLSMVGAIMRATQLKLRAKDSFCKTRQWDGLEYILTPLPPRFIS